MEEAGKITEQILKYLKAGRNVKRVSIKDTFGLEDEKIDEILKLLRDLKLIVMNDHVNITESGLEFLQL